MNTNCFVWDATGPLYAELSEHTAWLLEAADRGRRHVVPEKVVTECRVHGAVIDTDSFESDPLGGFDDLIRLNYWLSRLGSQPTGEVAADPQRDAGETWTATLAEKLEAIAIIDDQDASGVIRHLTDGRLRTHGALWAISRGVIEERVAGPSAYSGLCNGMLNVRTAHGGALRWPFRPGGYPDWFKKNRQRLEQL